MNNDKKLNQQRKNDQVSFEDFKERIEGKLITKGLSLRSDITKEQLYHAIAYAVKDNLILCRENFKNRSKIQGAKKVCYLCMEFLVGRNLKFNLVSLGLYENACKIISEFGYSFEDIENCERDPALGNGGLGRLAACFIDSCSALNYLANGYTLLYEHGLFKQRIIDGEQIELPDEWLSSGGVWLVPHPEKTVIVRFGGTVNERHRNGRFEYEYKDYDEVRAVPYDLLIPGNGGTAVNSIRLWRAKGSSNGNFSSDNQGSYLFNLSIEKSADRITKQLYPEDTFDEGKLLRLSQQYFLVSASLQSIIRDYLSENGSLENFENRICIHINDTHPALAIPELMRILMDIYSYDWDRSWNTVTKVISYTNHTVLPEALECWRTDLFSMKLPRIFMIINEINRRFTSDLWRLYPGDWDRISRMSVVAYNQIRMANLSVVGSQKINGVSDLHTNILKQTVFHDFYKMSPEKFVNVTNGVSHRRWLVNANSALCKLLNDLIGDDYITDFNSISELRRFSDDKDVMKHLLEIKHYNKESFSYYAFNKSGTRIDPYSLFDVQVKRMHEYKRQLMNVMKIISIYLDIDSSPSKEVTPQTFIFGCKAAPGYYIAKRIIKLIYYLAKEINDNPLTRDKLKIVLLEDYNVSLAELLIPAADVSEQISLAGKEASGTGCMKLMMNGALTLGTLDGANVEISEAVGRENIYIFGMNANEVTELWRNGYFSRNYYQASANLKNVINRLYEPIGGEDFSDIAEYLIGNGRGIADPFMCLADFDGYLNSYKTVIDDYSKQYEWAGKMLINIAASGRFSSDNSIKKYASDIWRINPIV